MKFCKCVKITPELKRKEKGEEREEEDEEMKKKLRRAKRQLLWESYLKFKMIKDNHNELLKFLMTWQTWSNTPSLPGH